MDKHITCLFCGDVDAPMGPCPSCGQKLLDLSNPDDRAFVEAARSPEGHSPTPSIVFITAMGVILGITALVGLLFMPILLVIAPVAFRLLLSALSRRQQRHPAWRDVPVLTDQNF